MYLYSLQIKGDSNKKIQFVPHRNHITSPVQNESSLKPIYMEVCYWALLFMPLVTLHHLLNVFVQPQKKNLGHCLEQMPPAEKSHSFQVRTHSHTLRSVSQGESNRGVKLIIHLPIETALPLPCHLKRTSHFVGRVTVLKVSKSVGEM
jgi:hypothetical protein